MPNTAETSMASSSATNTSLSGKRVFRKVNDDDLKRAKMEKLRELSLISGISRSSLEITKLVKQLQSKFAGRVLLRLTKDGDLIFIKCTCYAYCITSISGTLGAMMTGPRYL